MRYKSIWVHFEVNKSQKCEFFIPSEELSDTKERNVQLAARLQQREMDLEEARRDLETLAQEKERLREKVSYKLIKFFKYNHHK